MTSVRPDIDLGGFARAPVTIPPPRRRVLRWIVPLLLVAGFAAVIVTAFGDTLRPAVVVTLVRPVASEGPKSAGTVLLQAAGWVEPEPFPIRVTPLTGGVVAEVLVQPSETVSAGQVVARLVKDDALLEHRRAEAALELAVAEERRAAAEAAAATTELETLLELNEAAAAGPVLAQGRSAEATRRAEAVAKGEAQLAIAESELVVQRWLAAEGAAGLRQVEIAEARVREAQGEVAILRAEAAVAAAEAEDARIRAARAARALELRIEPKRAAEVAAADLLVAKAKVADAKTALDAAALRLQRMEVRAPANGLVLARLAMPGTVTSPDAADANAICTLYDPASLRIRVDVPQDLVAKAAVGQDTQILLSARPGAPYRGRVIRIVQEADINKTTLQVHVRVTDGDGLLRPEMLCQVRFLASGNEAAGAKGTPTVRIPARLVENGAVWVVDGETGRAARRSVEVEARDAEWAEVKRGLDLSDKVIDEGRAGLAVGARIRVRDGG